MQKSNLIRVLIGISLLANVIPNINAVVTSCLSGTNAAISSLTTVACAAGANDVCKLEELTPGLFTAGCSANAGCTASATVTCCSTDNCNTKVSSCYVSSVLNGVTTVEKKACASPNNLYCKKTTTTGASSTITVQSCAATCTVDESKFTSTTCCRTDDCNVVEQTCKSGSSRIDSNKLFASLFVLLGVSYKYFL